MVVQLFKCERMSAMISREQCDKNRYGVRGTTNRGTVAPRWACEGCSGLGLDAVSLDMNMEVVTMAKCSVPGCEKFVTKDGYCWGHCKSILGINPKTGKPLVVPSPSPAPAVEDKPAAINPVETDPRETFECPHCHAVLSSAEVELPSCPMCKGQLHSVDQGGEVCAPPAEKPIADFCDACGTYPCSCQAAETIVSAPLPDDWGKVTNLDGEKVEFGVDPVVVMAIREAMRDLEASWLIDLSGLSPCRAICETYHKIEQLQTLRS